MKPIKLLLSMFLFWMVIQNAPAQYFPVYQSYEDYIVSLPKNPLPSETAYRQYTGLIDHKQAGDDLRTAPPGESGWANKEVWAPIDAASWPMAIVALLMYILYKRIRRIQIKNKKTERLFRALPFILCLLCAIGSTQTVGAVIRANPDNYFVPINDPYMETGLDVLTNDNYGDDCYLDDLTITVTEDPTLGGWAYYDPAGHVIMYAPGVNAGVDSLTYSIQCPLSPAPVTAKVYIQIKDKPGVISDASCFVKPTGITMAISELARTNPASMPMDHLYTPIFGDVDGDGKVEIFSYQVGGTSAQYGISTYLHLLNFNGTAFTTKYSIPISNFTNQTMWPNENVAFAKITGTDGAGAGLVNYKPTASIFLCHHFDRTLKRYDLNGTAFTQTWSVANNTNDNPNYKLFSPFIADLMGDGHQQIICGDRVYNADTGQLLMVATTPAGAALVTASNNDQSFGRLGHQANTTPAYWYSAPIAVDVDGDGIQEIVGGDCVYKIQIGDYTSNNTTQNTYRLWRRANYQSNLTTKWDNNFTRVADGPTAIVDIDLDGQLEVVVGSKGTNPMATSTTAVLYIYNPRTGQLLHDNKIEDIPAAGVYGPGRPFTGDIDGDGRPEVCIAGNAMLDAYKLNVATRTLSRMWRLTTSDTSASTGLSLFDFNQSDTARMVYRDINTLRIIRSTPTAAVTEFSFANNLSDTANEYPTVGDIDGNGHAEILTISYSTGQRSSLRVFAASGVQKWAPARKVWHQASYNPTFINDDLTIPQYPLSPTAKFVNEDGKISRPFNNYLQQSTQLSRVGTMIQEGADLSFKAGAPRRISVDASGNMVVNITVSNLGDAAFTQPIVIQFWAYASGAYQTVGSVPSFSSPAPLAAGADRVISFTIPAASLPANVESYAATINRMNAPDAANSVPYNQEECRDYNNRALSFNLLDGEIILCEGASGTVTVNPENIYDVQWFKPGNVNPENGGAYSDSYTLTKDNSIVQYMLVHARYKPGLPNAGNLVSPLKDTIYIYRAPDSLVWNNNKGNGDWNDWGNWTNPNPAYHAYPQANVPLGCTNVLVRGNLGGYPDLTAANTTQLENWPTSTLPAANNIYFNFGGEVKRPDRLNYDSVHVNLALDAHRWYMLAPPLKNFYAGDIYLNSPIPVSDDIKAYTRLWNAYHPQGNYYESTWTSLFYEPGVAFLPGQGLGAWISSNDDVDRNYTFNFPKWDAGYNVYFENTTTPNPHIPFTPTSRTGAHRFIFDGAGANGADFNLSAEAKTTTSLVMVGNPFMAHLDFDAFYAANSAKIKNHYRVMDASGNWKYYRIGGPSDLTQYIAPMQSFIVEANSTTFTTLTANGNMTSIVTGAGSTLKNGKAEAEANAETTAWFTLTVWQGNDGSKSYIGMDETGSKAYINNEDVISLFEPASESMGKVEIFSLSEDGKKLKLNMLPTDYLSTGGVIPLGVRTASTGSVSINVSNLPAVPQDMKVILYDAKANRECDLTKHSMYTFDDIEPDNELFVDDRFSLRFVKAETGIAPESLNDNDVAVVSEHNRLSVFATKPIDEIAVYNVQGQLVTIARPATGTATVELEGNALYIVKVKVGGQVYNRKTLVK